MRLRGLAVWAALTLAVFCSAMDATATSAGACITPLGDLNGDQRLDYALRPPASSHADAVVYVLTGDGSPPAADSDPRELSGRLITILRGPAAAPFDCPTPAALRQPAPLAVTATSRFQQPNADSALDAPTAYRLTNLDQVYGLNGSTAHAINAGGGLAGSHYTANWNARAYVEDGSVFYDLGTLGGHSSTAFAINAAGQSVGYSLTGDTDAYGFVHNAFLTEGPVMFDLGLPWSAAYGINDAGDIVGEILDATGAYRAFLLQDGALVDLGTLDGRQSFARAINRAGEVVGTANSTVAATGEHAEHAFLYRGGAMHNLGSLGYACVDFGNVQECTESSVATAINDRSEIAGYSTTSAGPSHAFLISDGVMSDLGTLGGQQSWAHGLNDSGQVVGTALDPAENYRAFLYERGEMFDLNQLIVEPFDAPLVWTAQAINNFGQIAGLSYRLDPLYPSITADREYALDSVLGSAVAFAYWIDKGPNPCPGGKPQIQLQARIETAATSSDPLTAKALRQASRWQPVEAPPEGCADSSDWQPARLAIPAALQGQPATIHLRLRQLGRNWSPTVYLRHFTMP